MYKLHSLALAFILVVSASGAHAESLTVSATASPTGRQVSLKGMRATTEICIDGKDTELRFAHIVISDLGGQRCGSVELLLPPQFDAVLCFGTAGACQITGTTTVPAMPSEGMITILQDGLVQRSVEASPSGRLMSMKMLHDPFTLVDVCIEGKGVQFEVGDLLTVRFGAAARGSFSCRELEHNGKPISNESGIYIVCKGSAGRCWFTARAEDTDKVRRGGRQEILGATRIGLRRKRSTMDDSRSLSEDAEAGDSHAQNNLGMEYLTGDNRTVDYEEASRWFRRAAEKGNRNAMHNLAGLYSEGRGVDQSFTKAREWFVRAAALGLDLAQFTLAQMYDKGKGVERDPKEAAKWYRRAAEQGHLESQVNLGLIYGTGDGVSRDYLEAAKWLKSAARRGHAEAQFNLGVLYYNGDGMPQSDAEALKWFRFAAAQGHKKAEDVLRRLR